MTSSALNLTLFSVPFGSTLPTPPENYELFYNDSAETDIFYNDSAQTDPFTTPKTVT
jgi:hypothetical protein